MMFVIEAQIRVNRMLTHCLCNWNEMEMPRQMHELARLGIVAASLCHSDAHNKCISVKYILQALTQKQRLLPFYKEAFEV